MTRIRPLHCFPLLFALSVPPGQSRAAGPENGPLQKIGAITHPPVKEASGLVKSRAHRGVFWTIADSGNRPHLYAIERSGRLIAEFRVAGAINVDWESLAIDNNGHLYIGDVGNNIFPGGLWLRWVYRIKEPNPRVPPRPSTEHGELPAVRVENKYVYSFPNKPFDVEAMFSRNGRLYLIEKARESPARFYRLPLKDQISPITLIKVGRLPHPGRVTGSSISEDGRYLAVCGYRQATIFTLQPGLPIGKQLKKAVMQVTITKKGIESCCWNRAELLLASENRSLYAVDLSGMIDRRKGCKPKRSFR